MNLADLLAAQIDGRADRAQAAVDAATQPHRIRWFGVLPDGERVPRNRHMNGGDWGRDATCSCSWDSRTGGAIQERIREAIADHRSVAEWNATHPGQQIAVAS